MDSIARVPGLVADEDETGLVQLANLAIEIAVLENWVHDSPELRPFVAFSLTIKKAVSSIVRVFDVILDALEAPTIEEAQDIQRDLQRFLDEAAAAIGDGNTLLERLGRIQDAANPSAAWLNEAFGSDPVSTAASGATLLKANQLKDSCINSQIHAVLWDTILRTISDVEAFWTGVVDYHRLLCTHQDRVLKIVASRNFQERLATTREDALTFAYRVAVIDDAETLRQVVTELLEHAHYLIEQPLKLHLGLLSACVTRKSFEQTQAQDVSALMSVAALHRPNNSISIDTAVRNAKSHRDYRITDDNQIELSPARACAQSRSAVAISEEELCDAVIRIAEDCAMMDMALMLLCGDRLEATLDTYSSFLIRVIAEGMLDWIDINVERTGDEIVVSGRCLRRVKRGDLAMLACLPLEDRTRLVLRLGDVELVDHEIVVPVNKYVAWSRITDDPQKMIAFLDLSRNTLLDGRSTFDDVYIRKCISMKVIDRLVDKFLEFSELRAELSAWRDAAKSWNFHDLARAIAAAIGSKAGAPSSGAFLDTLTSMAREEVDEPGEFIL